MIRNYKFHNPEGGCFVSFAKTFYEHTARSAELDKETGYYYYGVRYYTPQISAWLSVDPIAVYNPVFEVEHYIDGQHNGGVFNSGNLNVYGYTYQNPIFWIDPNGKQVEWNKLEANWPRYKNDPNRLRGEVAGDIIGKFVYGNHYSNGEVDGIQYGNFCATRASVAYNRLGKQKELILDFYGQNGEMKGKPVTSTAKKFKTVMDKIYRGNEDKIIKIENPSSKEEIQEVFGDKKGTFIMIAEDDAGYTGHVSIYDGEKVVGGNENMHAESAKEVYLYVADEE